MLLEVVLILACVLTFWIRYRIVNRSWFKLIQNFDYFADHRGYPVIGHLPLFFWKTPNDKVKMLCSEALKTERTVKLWFFSKLVIILNTPQDVQTVLSSHHCLGKGSPYDVLAGTGSGLITASPAKWKPYRRFLNKPFIFQNLIKEIPKINRISRQIVHDLMPHCDAGEISLIDIIGYRLLDITLSVLLDYSFDKTTLLRSFHNIEESMVLTGKRLIKFYSTYVVIFFEKLLRIVPREQKLLYGLFDILEAGLIEGKEKYLPEIEKDAEKMLSDDELRNRPDGFLKRMYRMKYHNQITDQAFEDNVGQFLVAGIDTSTTALGNIILCLATYPQVQEKLYAELNTVMADSDELDWDKITRLEYLDRVIKECFRFLPILPIVIRKADKNIQLEEGIIPAGTDIVLLINNIHRRASIWGPNVEQFNPDNFLPENCKERHPCSFIPFSYGPRSCIGYKYAMISVRIVIAHLIKNFRFTTNLKIDELNFVYGVTTKPENGYRISLSKRD